MREWFGQRDRAILWGLEGMSSLVWEAFVEFTYVESQISLCRFAGILRVVMLSLRSVN